MRRIVFPFALGVLISGCGLDLGRELSPGSSPRVKPGGTEPGRLQGITAAHNAVRAAVSASPGLPDLAWSAELAQVAQNYATHLSTSCELVHSHGAFGENLASFGGQRGDPGTVVQLWADERKCWTYGAFMKSDACSSSCDACGHYTQLVWRDTQFVGCGVADCPGTGAREVWVCNYYPPGNFIGEPPY